MKKKLVADRECVDPHSNHAPFSLPFSVATFSYKEKQPISKYITIFIFFYNKKIKGKNTNYIRNIINNIHIL